MATMLLARPCDLQRSAVIKLAISRRATIADVMSCGAESKVVNRQGSFHVRKKQFVSRTGRPCLPVPVRPRLGRGRLPSFPEHGAHGPGSGGNDGGRPAQGRHRALGLHVQSSGQQRRFFLPAVQYPQRDADRAPRFRAAFASRRCLVPINGFYEWRNGNGVRTPLWIHRADELPLAGIYNAGLDQAAACVISARPTRWWSPSTTGCPSC